MKTEAPTEKIQVFMFLFFLNKGQTNELESASILCVTHVFIDIFIIHLSWFN